jgi:hypothetical protein
LNGHGQSSEEVKENGSNGGDESGGISESGDGYEDSEEVFEIGETAESNEARTYVEDEEGSI